MYYYIADSYYCIWLCKIGYVHHRMNYIYFIHGFRLLFVYIYIFGCSVTVCKWQQHRQPPLSFTVVLSQKYIATATATTTAIATNTTVFAFVWNNNLCVLCTPCLDLYPIYIDFIHTLYALESWQYNGGPTFSLRILFVLYTVCPFIVHRHRCHCWCRIFVFFAAHLNRLRWPTNFSWNKSYLTWIFCVFFSLCCNKRMTQQRKQTLDQNWH